MALTNGNSPATSIAASSGSDSTEQVTLCHICSDRATGNHYGAISCDGCKGFFRRSIRKEHNYKCRFQQNCNVDKTHRNACRACRLRRCLVAGMRQNAIQNERDIIGKRRKLESEGETSSAFLQSLIHSEQRCLQLRESVIKSTEQVVYDKGKIKYEQRNYATLNDVGTSIHQQLCILVEWAKSLGQFQELCLNDQAALLKANAAPLIVLGVAYRSLNTDGGVYLANEKILPLNQATLIGDINLVVARIINELVLPMRELNYDATDYVALKAALFFNPYSIRTSNSTSVSILKNARLLALKILKNSKNDDPDECRYGQLLLLLPAVHSIAQQLVEDVQLCHLFQLTNVDDLMQELILHDGKAKESSGEAIIEKLKMFVIEMLVFLLIAFFPHPANGSNRDIQLNSTMIPAELQDAMKIVRNHVLFKQRVNINFNEFQVECVPPSDDSSHGKLIIRSKNFLKTIGDDSDVVGKRPLCPMEFRNNTIHINYNLIGTECEISTEDTQKLMETEQREIEQERRDKLISIIISIIVFLFVVIGIIFFCRKRRKSCQSTKRERIRAARTLIQASANTVIRRKVNRKISVKKVQRREVPMKRVRTKVEPVIKPPPRGEFDNKETDVSTSILQHLIIQDSSVPLLSVSKSVEVVIDPQNDQSISEEPSQSEVSSATVETSQECPEDSLGSVEDKVDGKQEKESEKNVNELLVIPDRNSKRKSPKADSIKHVNDIGKKVHFEYEDYLAAYKVFDYSWRSIWNLVPVSTDKMPTMNVYKQMTETVLESLIRHKLVKENQAKKMYDEYQLFFSCSQEVKPEDGDAEMICLDSAAALSFFEGAVKKLENMYQKDGIDTKQKRLVSLPDSVLTQLRSPYGLDHFSRVYAFVTRFGYCIRVSLEIMDIISIPLLYTVALLKNVDIEVKKKALTVMREKIREIYSIFDTETIESMPFPTCFVPSLVDKYGICDENDNQLEDSDDFSELLKECSLSTKSTKKYRKKDRKTKKTRKVNNSSEV